jgi:hypothetical protein
MTLDLFKQVVLANGTIVNASFKENPDLHKALKGGNNNFGIVTRFDLRAFPQGEIWAGHTYASPGRDNIPNRWFEYFASSRNSDLRGMIMFYANWGMGGWTNQAFISYAEPRQSAVYNGLMNASSISNVAVTTMAQVANENAVSTPSGTRSSFSTFTIVNSARFMDALLELGAEYAQTLPMLSTMDIIYQPLWTKPRATSFVFGGGNVLGLENDNRDLVIVLIHTIWSDASITETVKENMKSFINQAQDLARQHSVYHPYLYLNYAEDFQDVMRSYGAKSVAFMQKTAAKYDPTGLFQRRVPGGFKLPRVRAQQPIAAPILPISRPIVPTSPVATTPAITPPVIAPPVVLPPQSVPRGSAPPVEAPVEPVPEPLESITTPELTEPVEPASPSDDPPPISEEEEEFAGEAPAAPAQAEPVVQQQAGGFPLAGLLPFLGSPGPVLNPQAFAPGGAVADETEVAVERKVSHQARS